ncbi:MAG TPA: sigma-70 family RNA polymerase sigma factor [Verrucomicrobiae bacterium]
MEAQRTSCSEEFLPTGRSLLTRLKNWDDQEGWREFFETYWRLIYSVARKAGFNDAEAQDLVQETILAVARKVRDFHYDPALGSFKSWLLLNVRSRIADQLRRRQARIQTVAPGAGDGPRTALMERVPDPAAELLALYARRWEQEVCYKELKVDMRPTPYPQSHTPLTAIQEIAALILAYAVLVDYRVEAAGVGQVGVLRISFLRTLQLVQGLWQSLELSGDLLNPAQVRLVVHRALRQIAEMAIPKRRARLCPRALRQPVSSRPRVRKNTYRTGSPGYSVGENYASRRRGEPAAVMRDKSNVARDYGLMIPEAYPSDRVPLSTVRREK